MIARDWHGVVPEAKADEYLPLLIRVGLGDYEKTPGNRGSYVLRRRASDVTYFRLISFWESTESIRAYTGGGDIEVPQYTTFDPNYLVELEPMVLHYTVNQQAGNPRKRQKGMVARTWHGAVPIEKSDTYLNLMETVALAEYEASPGNQGAFLLHRTADDAVHFAMLTFWDSLDTIRAFAGKSIDIAKYYDFDPYYLIEMEPTVLHHEVFELCDQ